MVDGCLLLTSSIMHMWMWILSPPPPPADPRISDRERVCVLESSLQLALHCQKSESPPKRSIFIFLPFVMWECRKELLCQSPLHIRQTTIIYRYMPPHLPGFTLTGALTENKGMFRAMLACNAVSWHGFGIVNVVLQTDTQTLVAKLSK